MKRSRIVLLPIAACLGAAALLFLLGSRDGHFGVDPRDKKRLQQSATSTGEILSRLRAQRRGVPKFVLPTVAPRFPGLPDFVPHRPDLLFTLEVRDKAWAPAMERNLSEMLSPQSLSSVGLQELRVNEISCRQTTCKLVYEFPSRLVDLVTATGYPASSPLVLLEERFGRPAPRSGGFQEQSFERNGETYSFATVIFGFDSESWDPKEYRAWVGRQLPATREFFHRARLEWSSKRSTRFGASSPGGASQDAG